jgi:hypothetical protein
MSKKKVGVGTENPTFHFGDFRVDYLLTIIHCNRPICGLKQHQPNGYRPHNKPSIPARKLARGGKVTIPQQSWWEGQ